MEQQDVRIYGKHSLQTLRNWFSEQNTIIK